MSRIKTPEAILSYPHLFEPQESDEPGQKAKYSCALIFPEGTDLTALKKAVVEAAKEEWGDKAVQMIRSGEARSPFRTDWEKKGYPENSTFFNARSTRKPGIVSTIPDPNTGLPMKIDDPEEMYPGAIVLAGVSVFTYDRKGNKGVGFGLDVLQKIRDSERLDNAVNAQDFFEADENAAADLDDVLDDEALGDGAPEGSDDLDVSALI